MQADCSLNPNWHRNDVGIYRRSKRTQRRKFGYSLPDGDTIYAHLQTYITDELMPFVIECDGKMLLDGRYVPCKERNIVDPFAADNFVGREELVSA